MTTRSVLLLFATACSTVRPADLAGSWSGTIDCDGTSFGWGAPSDYAMDLQLEPDGDALTGSLHYVFDATDADGAMFSAGTRVQLEFDLTHQATISEDQVQVELRDCIDYTVIVDGDPDLSPVTCDDVTLDDTTVILRYDGSMLQYVAGLPMQDCMGALGR